MIKEKSITVLLDAKSEIIICSNFQGCNLGKPSHICCLSCGEFHKCKEICKSAEIWDIKLQKCARATNIMSQFNGQYKYELLNESIYLKGKIDAGDISSKTLNRLSTVLDQLHEILKN